ncbi:Ser/Thr protein phosphatase, putative [Trichomonas vaginalis G3]|uniref:Serine/threonine-protein phosphatase n=1 Tax=Trichomonas vaginalis (strain ATCC PRA-98 / G3) TaxID=412133 RepID=A2EYQ8_TRIV3|nr:phosphoprotein phosphatase protein [Trichomonas vaginalis G3]EAY02205.1 Ser/Thr protein phosphatase, putative [Trichomonas vaginalis G3]KAI5501036.1 phosphoprotein phosphatase protein [Trichomonas vaginalis G3]|eukprot:XP_001314543.1 Ser/Thr protein phosphatase [Trichomonas vaginalis G3]
MSESLNLDAILESCKKGEQLSEGVFVELMLKLMEQLASESNLLELQSPIIICGDVHGQLFDLFELFDAAGDPAKYTFLFMGDYVDRGYYSVLTFSYLAALKLKYKDHIWLLRGNHECRQVNQMYGFYAECQMLFGHPGIWSLCNEVFDLLPMASIIDNEVFSVHGGISPDIALIEKINMIERNEEIPNKGPFCDLTWSDPEEGDQWRNNSRGAGYIFGARQVKEFCQLNNLKMITRSHQLAQNGYEWFFDNKLITVWSAPNYMYRTGNKATIMKYNHGEYELVEFQPCPASRSKVPDELPTSGYFI